MPVYRYKAKIEGKSCNLCKKGFEVLQNINDRPLENCPECGAEVIRIFSEFSVGFSKTDLDRRAREKGFHKLKKVDKGKYEKLY